MLNLMEFVLKKLQSDFDIYKSIVTY